MPVSPSDTKYDDDDLDSLYKAIGFIVIQWGQAEQSLDIIVAILFQNFGGKKLAKRIPVMLTPKLEFVNKCLSNIPALASFKADGESLISNFDKLSGKRHDLVHGAIANLFLEDGAFMFAKLDVQNDFHVLREFRFDSAEFPTLTKELVSLGADATKLARRIWDRREEPQ